MLLCALVGALTLTGALAAILRTGLNIKIELAIYCSLPLAFLIGAGAAKCLNRQNAPIVLCGILFGGLFSIALWQSRYYGMPALGGADAANHLLMQESFIRSDSQTYSGFTIWYGLSIWLELLGVGGSFECYRAIIYAIPPLFFGLIGFAAAAIFGRVGIVTFYFYAFLIITSWLAFLARFHYFQSDGFFGNLLSLLPVAFTWLAWSCTNSLPARLGLSLCGLLLVRFTYGLNLGDLALTLALLALLEPIKAFWRAALSIFLLALAAYFYMLLTPVIWQSSGGIIPYGVTRDAVALSLLSFVLLCLIPMDGRPNTNRSRTFCGVFGAVSTSAALLYKFTTPAPQYYVFKYLFVCAFLVSTVTLLHICANFVRLRQLAVTRLVLICCCFGISIWMQHRSLSPYQRSLSERLSSDSRTRFLQPLLDRDVLEGIKTTLTTSQMDFGGYLTGSWPQSAFLNALLKHPLGLAQYRAGELQNERGYCIFWNAARATPNALRARNAEAAAEKIAAWNEDPFSKFIPVGGNREIGYRCS